MTLWHVLGGRFFAVWEYISHNQVLTGIIIANASVWAQRFWSNRQHADHGRQLTATKKLAEDTNAKINQLHERLNGNGRDHD